MDTHLRTPAGTNNRVDEIRWKQPVTLKRRYAFSRLHGVTPHTPDDGNISNFVRYYYAIRATSLPITWTLSLPLSYNAVPFNPHYNHSWSLQTRYFQHVPRLRCEGSSFTKSKTDRNAVQIKRLAWKCQEVQCLRSKTCHLLQNVQGGSNMTGTICV